MDRVIDAVGIDANRPHSGPAAKPNAKKHAKEKEKTAPGANPKVGNWEPGDAPSLVLSWSVEAVAKAGTVSIIGVYGEVEPHALFDLQFSFVCHRCAQAARRRLLSGSSIFLYRCASQNGILERKGNIWSPPNIDNQCGSETRQAGATLVPNARIDDTRRTLF